MAAIVSINIIIVLKLLLLSCAILLLWNAVTELPLQPIARSIPLDIRSNAKDLQHIFNFILSSIFIVLLNFHFVNHFEEISLLHILLLWFIRAFSSWLPVILTFLALLFFFCLVIKFFERSSSLDPKLASLTQLSSKKGEK